MNVGGIVSVVLCSKVDIIIGGTLFGRNLIARGMRSAKTDTGIDRLRFLPLARTTLLVGQLELMMSTVFDI